MGNGLLLSRSCAHLLTICHNLAHTVPAARLSFGRADPQGGRLSGDISRTVAGHLFLCAASPETSTSLASQRLQVAGPTAQGTLHLKIIAHLPDDFACGIRVLALSKASAGYYNFM